MTFGESCVFKLCKSFIKYLILFKIMYNNFTNTLIYKLFTFSIQARYLYATIIPTFWTPITPQSFTFTPTPHYPTSIFFLFLKNSNTSYPLLFIHSLFFFSSNFKTTPLIIFTLFYFFSFFLQITHISF